MKIGEIRYNKLGTPMRIVEIRSNEDITIEFLDLHNMKKKTTYSNFKNGGIKNPYDRSLKGVGYLGEGEYMTGQSPYDRRVFGIWIGMIDRCYNENTREKYTDDDIVKIRVLLSKGLSYAEIAKETGRTYYGIDHLCGTIYSERMQ